MDCNCTPQDVEADLSLIPVLGKKIAYIPFNFPNFYPSHAQFHVRFIITLQIEGTKVNGYDSI